MHKISAQLLINIGELLSLRSAANGPRRGASLSELGIIQDAAVLCLGGKIVSVGTTKDALRDRWLKKNRKKIVEIDCGGRVVLPGFVDSHTHPVFMHPRLVDFEKRISGANYEEIAEAGGGIRSSTDGVRKASKSELTQRLSTVLADFAGHGTTTVEAKSGYGLSPESELKSLDAIRAAALQWPGTVVPTFLGAHAVPVEYRGSPRKYVALVCNEMMPAVAKRKLAAFRGRVLRSWSVQRRRDCADFCGRGEIPSRRPRTYGPTQPNAAWGAASLPPCISRPYGLRERRRPARPR